MFCVAGNIVEYYDWKTYFYSNNYYLSDVMKNWSNFQGDPDLSLLFLLPWYTGSWEWKEWTSFKSLAFYGGIEAVCKTRDWNWFNWRQCKNVAMMQKWGSAFSAMMCCLSREGWHWTMKRIKWYLSNTWRSQSKADTNIMGFLKLMTLHREIWRTELRVYIWRSSN